MNAQTGARTRRDRSRSYAWLRLAVAVTMSTVGGVGMWSVMVALPAMQADFGVDRAEASLPFTLTMFGFAGGGVLMGRLADRFGIALPLAIGNAGARAGYLAAGVVGEPLAVRPRAGAADRRLAARPASAPLMADISHWFVRRRGIAVAIAASGNYLAGTIWPPVVQHFIATTAGARRTSASACFASSPCCRWLLVLRRRLDAEKRCRRRRPTPHAAAGSGFPRRVANAAVHRRASAVASPCRCRRCTSSPIAAILVTALRAAPKCCR